jgi:hypothetical protein
MPMQNTLPANNTNKPFLDPVIVPLSYLAQLTFYFLIRFHIIVLMNEALNKLLEELAAAGEKMSYSKASLRLGFNVIPELQKITEKEIRKTGALFKTGLIVNKNLRRPGKGFFRQVSTCKHFTRNSKLNEIENYHLQMQRIDTKLDRKSKPKE